MEQTITTGKDTASNETVVEIQEDQIRTLSNMRNCLRSAASVVSSASTTLGQDIRGHESRYGSDFGDLFPPQHLDMTFDWIAANRIDEFEESNTNPSGDGRTASTDPFGRIEEAATSDQWDSDEEVETELTQALLKQGKAKLQSKEYEAAERFFEGCLGRLSDAPSASGLSINKMDQGLHLDALTHLIIAIRALEKWEDAERLLKRKITLTSRSSLVDISSLEDTLQLTEVLLEKKDYTEALLYGRRAYKAYKKRGSAGFDGSKQSLALLIKICGATGKSLEADAYSAMLSDLEEVAEETESDTSMFSPTQDIRTLYHTESRSSLSPDVNGTYNPFRSRSATSSNAFDRLIPSPHPQIQLNSSVLPPTRETNPFLRPRLLSPENHPSSLAVDSNPFRLHRKSESNLDSRLNTFQPERPSSQHAAIEMPDTSIQVRYHDDSKFPFSDRHPPHADRAELHAGRMFGSIPAELEAPQKINLHNIHDLLVELDTTKEYKSHYLSSLDFNTSCQKEYGEYPRRFDSQKLPSEFNGRRELLNFQSNPFGGKINTASVLISGAKGCGKSALRR
jgi:tetratricopeptide (TPR) repeat protein